MAKKPKGQPSKSWENCLQSPKEKPQEIQTFNLMQKKQMESGTRIYS